MVLWAMAAPSPHRPFAVRSINAMGAGLRRLGLDVPRFDAAYLIDRATKQTGLRDFGEGPWRQGLELMCSEVAATSDPNTIGRLACQNMLSMALEQRLQLTAHRAAHPAVRDTPIERPLFVVGLPRTGTTILFNLLAQDPSNRAPLTWEVTRPHPPPETATYATDPRIDEVRKIFTQLDKLAPSLAAIHEFGAQLPQECPPIFAGTMLSMQFHILFRVPAYQAWLDTQSMVPAYAWHRMFLQHLQSRHRRERWVLKSPAHLPCVEDLLAVYPDARILFTHRAPLRALASTASLYYVFRGMYSDTADPAQVGADVADTWIEYLRRAKAARERLGDRPDQFLDVEFPDICDDPVGVVSRAYAHFGIEMTDQARSAMDVFLAANPRGSRGAHRYELEDFGLDPADLEARLPTG